MTTSVRLLISDIDGTLVPHDKVLTQRSLAAVEKLRSAGILFALTSSRPPRGVAQYVAPLQLTTPIGAFNGGVIVDPQLRVLQEQRIDDDHVATTISLLDEHGVSVWVYQGDEWYVRDLQGPHVAREALVTQFEPHVVANFDAVSRDVAKIVGVSDDVAALTKVRLTLEAEIGECLSATNSQTFFLDITNPHANKGSVVDFLSARLNIPVAEIATIGDAQNDVSMFARSGLSIAMGNGTADVRSAADKVTTSNEDEGFARAVEQFILS